MRSIFAAFNFKSASLVAEEKNYADNHVRLAQQLPGLRSYLTGKMIAPSGQQPPYYRAVTLSFDDEAAMRAATRESAVAKPLADDGAAHLTNIRWLELDSQVIVPFDSKRPGASYLLMAAEFDLKPLGADPAADDRRYLDHHTHLARQMPGLRHYVTGRLVQTGRVKPDRLRMAFLVFDNAAALRDAYRSPLGQELIKDEEATIANARVYRLGATVQI